MNLIYVFNNMVQKDQNQQDTNVLYRQLHSLCNQDTFLCVTWKPKTAALTIHLTSIWHSIDTSFCHPNGVV